MAHKKSICGFVRNIIVYGGITVAGLYALASCERRPKDQPPSALEKTADQGLEGIQDGLGYTRKGVDWLDRRVQGCRDYLNVGEKK